MRLSVAIKGFGYISRWILTREGVTVEHGKGYGLMCVISKSWLAGVRDFKSHRPRTGAQPQRSACARL